MIIDGKILDELTAKAKASPRLRLGMDLRNTPEDNSQRMLKDIRDVQSIETLVKSNIKNNQQILKNIEKSLLSIEFDQQYLMKYLEDGYLSKADLLEFYQREDIKAKYKLLAKDIEIGEENEV